MSFLNGMQRVLLFTHDLALATVAQEVSSRSLILTVIKIVKKYK